MATFGYANKPYLPAALQQQMLLDPRYQMASQLAKTDTSPVASPLAGIARMLSGALGGYQLGKVQQEYQKQGEGYNQALAQALRAGQQGVKGWVDPDTGQQAIPDVAPGRDAMMTAISMSGNPMLQEEASRAQMASMLKEGNSEFERLLGNTALSPEQKEELKRKYLETKASPLVPVFNPNTNRVEFGPKGGGNLPPQAAPAAAQTPKIKDLPPNVIKELGSKYQGVDQQKRLARTFQDDYAGAMLDWTGELENTIGKKFGDSGQAQWWQDYQTYVNQVRNDLFGAALTAQEKGEFLKAMVTPGMDPQQVRQNIARQEKISEDAYKRFFGTYSKGNYNKDQLGDYDPQNLNAGGGPAVVAPANANPSAPEITAVNPQTGQRIKFVNGQWVESQ